MGEMLIGKGGIDSYLVFAMIPRPETVVWWHDTHLAGI